MTLGNIHHTSVRVDILGNLQWQSSKKAQLVESAEASIMFNEADLKTQTVLAEMMGLEAAECSPESPEISE